MLDCLGPKDVAGRLGISGRNAARRMNSGDIPSFRVGKFLRTTELHLEAYIDRGILEAQGKLPSGGAPSSGLPQTSVKFISPSPSRGVVIRSSAIKTGLSKRKPA